MKSGIFPSSAPYTMLLSNVPSEPRMDNLAEIGGPMKTIAAIILLSCAFGQYKAPSAEDGWPPITFS